MQSWVELAAIICQREATSPLCAPCNARSIVAALIASKPARISGASWKWPCRSIAAIRIGASGRSRDPLRN